MARDSGGGGLGTVITWGAVGLGAYLIYNWWQNQTATAAAAAVPPSTTTAAASSTAPTPSSATASSLDALYLSMVQAANKANPWASAPYSAHPGTLNPDQWGYYLGQVSGTPAPDPLQAFPSFNRSTKWPNITSAQYWTNIAPLVAAQKGLSGLGFYGALGRWAWGQR